MISTLKAMATVPGDDVWGAKSAGQRFGLREPRMLKAGCRKEVLFSCLRHLTQKIHQRILPLNTANSNNVFICLLYESLEAENSEETSMPKKSEN